VLVLGLGLRLALTFSYTPAYLSYIDSWGYAQEAAGPLFIPNFYRPAGYSAFLAGLHVVTGSLRETVAIQHLLGLGTAGILYAAMLRLGEPRWVALVPAAVAALTLDGIYFEHTLLSEWLFLLLLAAALLAAAGSAEPRSATRRTLALAAATGVLLGLATTVRGNGLFAIPVFMLALLIRPADGWRARILSPMAVGAGAAVIILGYVTVQYRETDYWGLTDGHGWALYGRAAPFADCRAFTPPAGTRRLCERSDARVRSGPQYYFWNGNSPAFLLFPRGPTSGDETLGSFGRAAILGQPKAYLRAVGRDLWRYVAPDSGSGKLPGFGSPPASLDLRTRVPHWEEFNRKAVDPLYNRPPPIRLRGLVQDLGAIQAVVRVHGVLILAATVLTLVALPLRGRQRVTLLMCGGVVIVCLVGSTAVQLYNWRYAVPFLPFLLASGAVGARVLTERIRGRAGQRAGIRG
jgi:hypothetical protein